MLFELAHVPMPAGYGEALLSLEECKRHLQVEEDETEFDDLIAVLRDAAIEFVERYCELKMGPVTGIEWRAEGLPSDSTRHLDLGLQTITAITAVGYSTADGTVIAADAADFRVSARGHLRPAVSKSWPTDIGGAVSVTFDAGYPAGECPQALLQAVRLMLGHFFMNREAVIVGTISGEVPVGVTALCGPYRIHRI